MRENNTVWNVTVPCPVPRNVSCRNKDIHLISKNKKKMVGRFEKTATSIKGLPV